jgi:drug/metabolite transporter (DMT)-like permease
LGERFALRRVLAVLVALAGALVVLRPGMREVGLGHLAMLANGLFFSSSYLIAKVMADRLPASVVVGWLSITVTLALAPFAIAVWVPVSAGDWALLFVVAALATAGHYTMTLALGAAPIAVTQPVTFLQLIWATALGALAFAEPVDPFVMLGGLLIVGSVCFIAWREYVLRRRAVTPPPMAAKF